MSPVGDFRRCLIRSGHVTFLYDAQFSDDIPKDGRKSYYNIVALKVGVRQRYIYSDTISQTLDNCSIVTNLKCITARTLTPLFSHTQYNVKLSPMLLHICSVRSNKFLFDVGVSRVSLSLSLFLFPRNVLNILRGILLRFVKNISRFARARWCVFLDLPEVRYHWRGVIDHIRSGINGTTRRDGRSFTARKTVHACDDVAACNNSAIDYSRSRESLKTSAFS